MSKYAFNGLLYSSGTAAETTGNSGWLKLPGPTRGNPIYEKAFFHMLPADFASTETIDILLHLGFDSAGAGGQLIHTFTQIDSNNTLENLIIPGEESTAILTTYYDGTTEAANKGYGVLPSFYKLLWTIANGPATGATFKVYMSAFG